MLGKRRLFEKVCIETKRKRKLNNEESLCSYQYCIKRTIGQVLVIQKGIKEGKCIERLKKNNISYHHRELYISSSKQ